MYGPQAAYGGQMLNGNYRPAMAYGAFGDSGPGYEGEAVDPFGSMPSQLKPAAKIRLVPHRSRVNLLPIILNVVVPLAFFAGIHAALCFQIHYTHRILIRWILAGGIAIVFISACVALAKKVRTFLTKARGAAVQAPPTWHTVNFVLMLVALVAACILGEKVYNDYTLPYYNIRGLGTYTNVYPNRMRGQQLLDAGMVTFAPDSRLDLSRAMGFKDGTTYCVAPITFGNSSDMPTFDFWAVGTDCCSATAADFHCPGFQNRVATGGLRIMSESERTFYRLAVQEAEAQYGIRAAHPLFFTWTAEPVKMVEEWRGRILYTYIRNVFAFALWQVAAVAFVTMIFSKLGQLDK